MRILAFCNRTFASTTPHYISGAHHVSLLRACYAIECLMNSRFPALYTLIVETTGLQRAIAVC